MHLVRIVLYKAEIERSRLFYLDRKSNRSDRYYSNKNVDNSVRSLFITCRKAGCYKARELFFSWGYVSINSQLDQDHYYI